MAKKLECDRCAELGQMGQLKAWGTLTLKSEDGTTIVYKDLCPNCLAQVRNFTNPQPQPVRHVYAGGV